MPNKPAVTPCQMAARIAERANNRIFKKQYIYEILQMYMEECQNALPRGERVLIAGVGTIISEVKITEKFILPVCNKDGENPPFTYMRMTRNSHFLEKMNQTLMKKIENGIYGLEQIPFTEEQMDYLKEKGFVPKDAKLPDEEEKNGNKSK